MSEKNYCIGVDVGTVFARSIIVYAVNGNEVASAVHHCTSWVMDYTVMR